MRHGLRQNAFEGLFRMHVPLLRPVISEEAIQAVGEVLRSGWLGLGPRTHEFESAFAAYVGSRYFVGLNSCSAALHLALHVLDLPEGSEVITTPLTFISTNHAILYERCTPVFADVQANTGNLDVASVSSKITERTKAIMAVHLAGYPCDLDELYALARSRGLPVIEDCAHACGAAYKGKRIGSHGELHAFSFQAVKNLPTGDGGGLVVQNERLDARLRRLRWLGIDKDTFGRAQGASYSWNYNVTELGFKYHMNDIQAAIGLVQLQRLDKENARRAEIAERYRRGLAAVPGVRLLQQSNDRKGSNHLFCILVENRDDLALKLKTAGIETGVHFRRNDLYPMYRYDGSLVNAEQFWQSCLSLPMHLMLTDDQVEYVIEHIRGGW
jgi:perosamine synthetase